MEILSASNKHSEFTIIDEILFEPLRRALGAVMGGALTSFLTLVKNGIVMVHQREYRIEKNA